MKPLYAMTPIEIEAEMERARAGGDERRAEDMSSQLSLLRRIGDAFSAGEKP